MATPKRERSRTTSDQGRGPGPGPRKPDHRPRPTHFQPPAGVGPFQRRGPGSRGSSAVVLPQGLDGIHGDAVLLSQVEIRRLGHQGRSHPRSALPELHDDHHDDLRGSASGPGDTGEPGMVGVGGVLDRSGLPHEVPVLQGRHVGRAPRIGPRPSSPPAWFPAPPGKDSGSIPPPGSSRSCRRRGGGAEPSRAMAR